MSEGTVNLTEQIFVAGSYFQLSIPRDESEGVEKEAVADEEHFE
jgi:hypothetical protein